MPKHQILMGVSIALLSSVAIWQTGWLLEHTSKGQWFARRYGELRARGIIRTFFFVTAVLGVLLALDVIRPMQW